MFELDNKTLGQSLIITGIIFTIIIMLWPILMIISSSTGDIETQLNYIKQNPIFYQINFLLASLIAPSLTSLLIIITLFLKTRKFTPILNSIGLLFLIPYVVCVSVSYTSQFTLLTNSLLIDNTIQAKNWYFGNFHSIPYFLNQLGYTFFALSGFCIGYRFLFEKYISKIFGILLVLSSLLSVVAFTGLALNNKIINNATVVSGLCTIPFGIIGIMIGIKLKRTKQLI
jgi:CDP-diacylglycerol--glycerol-3-phosphate 3-phosphatidyltransferase